jgi:uncharacterized protein (DUF169 family)
MLKEDHWCWGALFGYGLSDPDVASQIPETSGQSKILPKLAYGRYIGMVSAPLKTALFIPDIILIYSNAAQLRKMLMPIKFGQPDLLISQFDSIDSCVYSVVPTLLTRQYRITIPDPGECERAEASDDEIILSVPSEKMETLVSGLKMAEKYAPSKELRETAMQPDFARPPFYTKMFEMWGLDTKKVETPPKSGERMPSQSKEYVK